MTGHASLVLLLSFAGLSGCKATFPHRVPEPRHCPDRSSEVARYLEFHEIDRRLRVAHQLSLIDREDLAEEQFASALSILVPALRELELKRPVSVSLDPSRRDGSWPGGSGLASALGPGTAPLVMPHLGIYDLEGERLLSSVWEYHPITLVHEMAHALVDQHFNVRRLLPDGRDNTDARLAQQAVLEGDAMLVTLAFLERGCRPLSVLTATESEIERLLDELDLHWSSPEPWAQQPRAQENAFRYLGGLRFVRSATRQGGWPALNRVYERMPVSTEQILHPEKYWGDREPPIEVSVALPDDLSAAGYELAEIDVVGELRIRALLRGDAEAAAGWGGDTYLLFRKPGHRSAIVWVSIWDTPGEAAEFAAAFRRLGEGQSEAARPSVERSDAMVVVIAGLEGETERAIAAALRIDHAPAPTEPEPEEDEPAAGPPCGTGEAQLSVMTLGSVGCRVAVAGEEIGWAPFFARPAPAGRCAIEITCEDGRTFSTERSLRPRRENRLIVHPTDWR